MRNKDLYRLGEENLKQNVLVRYLFELKFSRSRVFFIYYFFFHAHSYRGRNMRMKIIETHPCIVGVWVTSRCNTSSLLG